VEAVLEFYYNSSRFKKSLDYLIQFYSSPFNFYDKLANYYEVNGLFDRKVSSEEQYDILAKFVIENLCSKTINNDEENINEAFEYEKFIQYLKYDFIQHFNTKREWMPQYNPKWLKEKIDEKVKEMQIYIKDENIYKKYKFEMFEININSGEKQQNLVVLKR